jgi:hypothetical protein
MIGYVQIKLLYSAIIRRVFQTEKKIKKKEDLDFGNPSKSLNPKKIP